MNNTEIPEEQKTVLLNLVNNINASLSDHCKFHIQLVNISAIIFVFIGLLTVVLFGGYWVIYDEWFIRPSIFFYSALILVVFEKSFFKFKVREFETQFKKDNNVSVSIMDYTVTNEMEMEVERVKLETQDGKSMIIIVKP